MIGFSLCTSNLLMRVKYYYGIMAYLCDVSLYGMLYVADTATAA